MKDAGAYASTAKKATGEILDRLVAEVAEVGWSRANARRHQYHHPALPSRQYARPHQKQTPAA